MISGSTFMSDRKGGPVTPPVAANESNIPIRFGRVTETKYLDSPASDFYFTSRHSQTPFQPVIGLKRKVMLKTNSYPRKSNPIQEKKYSIVVSLYGTRPMVPMNCCKITML